MRRFFKSSCLAALLASNMACLTTHSGRGEAETTSAIGASSWTATPSAPAAPATARAEAPSAISERVVLAAAATKIPPTQRGQMLSAAVKSSCATHVFRDRGRAPIGYIKGVALTYAKSYCELKRGQQTAVTAMSQPLGGDTLDSLTHYGRADTTPLERLRAVYALAIGEGMRESAGNTTEGRDESVPERLATEANAEAGLFQVSFDSFASVKKVSPASETWLQSLYSQYQTPDAACELQTFMEGVRDRNKPVIGSGEGARFQTLTKTCPAFATEYVQVMLRSDLPHFGPIKRREAELFSGCEAMLKDIEVIADAACP